MLDLRRWTHPQKRIACVLAFKIAWRSNAKLNHLTSCPLRLNRRSEAFWISNTDPKRRVLLEADNLGDLFDERNAQPLTMVRAECEPIVAEAEPQPNRRVPAVRAGDKRVVDVGDRGLHLETAKGGDEFSLAGDGHAVFVIYAECEEQHSPSLVKSVRKILCLHKLRSAFSMISVVGSLLHLPRINPARTSFPEGHAQVRIYLHAIFEILRQTLARLVAQKCLKHPTNASVSSFSSGIIRLKQFFPFRNPQPLHHLNIFLKNNARFRKRCDRARHTLFPQ